MKDGDTVGLCALQKNYGYIGVKMADGKKRLVMVTAERGTPVEVANVPLERDVVHLKIDMDFKDRADRAAFFYSLDGRPWQSLGGTLKMSYTLPHFMGYRFGLFNMATQSAGGAVDFDYFRVAADPRDRATELH